MEIGKETREACASPISSLIVLLASLKRSSAPWCGDKEARFLISSVISWCRPPAKKLSAGRLGKQPVLP